MKTWPRIEQLQTATGFYRLVGLALAVQLLACQGDSQPEIDESSAGWILNGSNGAQALAEVRTVSLRRTSEINNQFGDIVAVGVDNGGQIFVADGIANRIFVFTPEGSLVAGLGRSGSGPGEFKWLKDIALRRDSVVAFDPGQDRVTVFPPNGEAGGNLRTVLVRDLGMRTTPVHGLLLGGAGELYLQFTGPTVTNDQIKNDSLVLRKLDPVGHLLQDSVLVIPNREWLFTPGQSGGYTVEPMPFGKKAVIRIGPQHQIYYSWTGASEIRVYNPGGDLLSIIEVSLLARPVTQQDYQELRRSIESHKNRYMRTKLRRLDAARDRGSLPETHPWMLDFTVDDMGRIWVNTLSDAHQLRLGRDSLEYTATDGKSRIILIDPVNRTVQEIGLQGSLRVAVVRDRKAYSIQTDSLGVESIAVLEVIESK